MRNLLTLFRNFVSTTYLKIDTPFPQIEIQVYEGNVQVISNTLKSGNVEKVQYATDQSGKYITGTVSIEQCLLVAWAIFDARKLRKRSIHYLRKWVKKIVLIYYQFA